MDVRRSRPVRPAVRSALAVVTAVVALTTAWQVASAATAPVAASAARGHLRPRHHHVAATEAETTRSVTLRPGDTLTVTLQGGWSTPRSSNPQALREAAATPAPAPGPVPATTFVAVAPGSATVEATRAPRCPPGRMCPMYLQVYRLSVRVTG